MLVLCDYCVIALGLSHDCDDIGTIFKLLFLQTKSPNIETFLYQISQLSQCRVSIPSQYRSLLLSHYVPTFFCYMTGILHWIIERVSLMFVTMPKCIIFNLRGCCIYRGCYNSIPAADNWLMQWRLNDDQVWCMRVDVVHYSVGTWLAI